MEKYIKTSENQELDDFLARNTALNYFQQDRIVPKICCFQESCCKGKLLQWSSLWIYKKSGGLEKKVKFGMYDHW